MEDNPTPRRERGKAMMLTPEQLEQEMQNMETVERRKQDTALKKRVLGWIGTFSQGETIDEREPAAQELMRVLNDPDTSDEVKRFIESRNREHGFVEWSGLRKTTKNLSEMGEIAQKMVDPSAPYNPDRSLQEMIDDPNVDDGVKELAQHFQEYLPKYNKFMGNEDPGFENDEKMGKLGTKDVIRDKDGGLLMKPSGSDDPRLIGTLIRSFEPMLEKKGRDTTAERQGKSVLTDETRGAGYITTVMRNPETSPMMKEMGQYMFQKARGFDPERARQYDPSQNERIKQIDQEKQQQEKQKTKTKTKKKGFGGFFSRD
jgi:hypothetical protein